MKIALALSVSDFTKITAAVAAALLVISTIGYSSLSVRDTLAPEIKNPKIIVQLTTENMTGSEVFAGADTSFAAYQSAINKR